MSGPVCDRCKSPTRFIGLMVCGEAGLVRQAFECVRKCPGPLFLVEPGKVRIDPMKRGQKP